MREAVFEDGRVDADLLVAADGIHSVARAQRYPEEGPPLWNGSLLWRGVAEIDPVLDGRSMIWAGHPEQKFVGYPIADLPSGRQLFNFIAELRRPESDLATREDWNRKGSLEDFLPVVRGVGLRLARCARHRPVGVGDVRVPDGRPRPVAPLDLRRDDVARGCGPPDVPDRLQRSVPGDPRRPGARRVPSAGPGPPAGRTGPLRVGPSTGDRGDRAGQPWLRARSCP